MEATKSLAKALAPPGQRQESALTTQKEVRHIIAVLRGSGERRWGAEEQHIDISAATAIPQAHLPCSEALLSSPE